MRVSYRSHSFSFSFVFDADWLHGLQLQKQLDEAMRVAPETRIKQMHK